MDLRLRVAHLVDRLHQAGDARSNTGEVAAGGRKTAVRLVFERRDAGEEELDGVQVARVGDTEVAVVLREGVEYRVELALLLGLVLPVGVHRQAEGIFPLVPIVDLDALELRLREDLVHRLIAGFPVEAARHVGVLFLEAQLLLTRLHVHVCLPL